MLTQQTIEHLIYLRLKGMADLYEKQLKDPSMASLTFDERLGLLTDAEVHVKSQAKLKRLLKQAKLKHSDACVENIDYKAKRGLERKVITQLKSCHWVEKSQHLIITGPTGLGKTWLSCALAMQVIRKFLSVLYFRLPRLLEDLEVARGDGTLPIFRAKIMRAKLVVLDDWGVNPLSVNGRQDLLEIVEDKTDTGSILITSQMPVSKWHDYIGEPTLADAILDRLVHRAHQIELSGESMRKLQGLNKETSNDS